MQIGLQLDSRNPPAWGQPWPAFLARTAELVEEGDRLGLGGAWVSEHHLFADGYMPQPLTWAAALAGRTKRMRIGTAVMLAPLHHPASIAEQAAVVDLLSDGRLELGLGAGYRHPEFGLFGVDIAERYPLLESVARDVRAHWETLTPPPAQARPPIWIGGNGPRAARIAGRLGEGLMTLHTESFETYATTLAKHHPGVAPRLGGPVNLFVADDPEAVWDTVAPHVAYQWTTYREMGAEGTEHEGSPRLAVTAERLRSAGPAMFPPNFDVVTPGEAVRRLREWLGGYPVEHVMFWATLPGLDWALAERHVELLATQVAPALV